MFTALFSSNTDVEEVVNLKRFTIKDCTNLYHFSIKEATGEDTVEFECKRYWNDIKHAEFDQQVIEQS